MGQTLTYGVYLPDEGERNCYSGLAQNWQILDNAVGAIAGKANASHTHGNITNDGAIGSTEGLPIITGTDGVLTTGTFGTASGTFCEGNDSRLSDARTPLAHTHSKADITDLFNSANTWTAQNTYTVTGDVPIKITNNKDATNPSATEIKHIRFVDENAKIIGGLGNSLESGGTSKMYLYSRSFSSDGSSNSNHGILIVNNKQTGVHEVQSESNFIPSANNSYDLGSSSYQWNNLYAKNYYYNGTQWGLDQANTWTSGQTIQGTYLGNEYSANARTQLYLMANRDTEGQSGIYIRTFRQNRTQGAMTSGDVSVYGIDVLENGTRTRGLNYFFSEWAGNIPKKLVVESSTEIFEIRPTLINGINPGALSFPDISQKSELTSEKTSWNKSGSRNTYTPTINGWIFIRVSGTTKCSINVHIGSTSNAYPTSYHEGESLASTILPMVANVPLYIYIIASDIEELWIMPSLGNV